MSEEPNASPPIAAFLSGSSLAAGAAEAAQALLSVLGSRRVEIHQIRDDAGRQVVERLAVARQHPDPDGDTGPGPEQSPGSAPDRDAAGGGAALAERAIASRIEASSGDMVAIALSAPGALLGALVVSPAPDLELLRREALLVALGMQASSQFNRVSELDRLKSEFVSIVSHELRTPLTTIKGCLDGIHRGYAGNPEALARMLGMARQNADRLGRLIDDLLDLARVERNGLQPRAVPVPIREVLQEVAASKAPAAEQQGVRFEAALPAVLPRVLGDEDRLFQAVANLVDNAIKFCRPGDDVRLEASVQGARCFIRVADTGPGIDPAKQMVIFEKFQQLDGSPRRKAGGVGLGLYITRTIVEAMGGRIRLTSTPGSGCTFEIDLPTASGAIAGGPTSGDILIIDDDPSFRHYLELVLSREGYRVHVADGPLNGVELARTLLPGLILVDLMMPDMDGWGVIERLEEDPATRDIPVAILSTLKPDLGAHRFRSYRYLEKSGHPGKLLGAIRDVVGALGPAGSRLSIEVPGGSASSGGSPHGG